MLLGYNTNGLLSHRLEDGLGLLADHGYRAVAITLDVAHLDPFRSTSAEIARIAALLDQLELRPIIETGARFLLDPSRKHEPTLMTREASAREKRLDFYRRAASIGRDLGAEVFSFWTGIDRVQPGSADSWSWLVDGVARTTALVRQVGLNPALEPEPGMGVGTMADWDRLCRILGADGPSLTLDIGHLYVTESESPVDLVRRYGSVASQVHLEDMKAGVHEHLPPGEGQVDFGGVLEALQQAGFRNAVCFELSRDGHRAPEMVGRCAELWKALRR